MDFKLYTNFITSAEHAVKIGHLKDEGFTKNELILLFLKNRNSPYYETFKEFVEQFEHDIFTKNIYKYVSTYEYETFPIILIIQKYLELKGTDNVTEGRKRLRQ